MNLQIPYDSILNCDEDLQNEFKKYVSPLIEGSFRYNMESGDLSDSSIEEICETCTKLNDKFNDIEKEENFDVTLYLNTLEKRLKNISCPKGSRAEKWLKKEFELIKYVKDGNIAEGKQKKEMEKIVKIYICLQRDLDETGMIKTFNYSINKDDVANIFLFELNLKERKTMNELVDKIKYNNISKADIIKLIKKHPISAIYILVMSGFIVGVPIGVFFSLLGMFGIFSTLISGLLDINNYKSKFKGLFTITTLVYFYGCLQDERI